MSGDELNDIMCEGLDEIAIGSTPSTFDQVLVGDLFRTRVDNVKVMFMIGLNDNVLPMSNSSTNLLNDKDRSAFKATSLNLAPDRVDKIYQERFYLYLMATKPKDKLIFSYSRMNSEGSSMAPCYFIKEIKRVLNDVRIEVVDAEVYLCSKNTLYRSTVDKLVSYENGESGVSPLNTMLKYIKEYDDVLLKRLNEAYSYKNHVAPISNKLIDRLFGKDLYLSVSRLEKYEECPFRHYINYGLSISENYDYSFQNNDYGNLFHRILEIYGSRVRDLGLSYSELSYEEHIKISDEAINQAFLELDYSFEENKRLHFYEDIIRDIAEDNIDVVAWQNKRSAFTPIGFEMSFNKHGDLNSPVISLDDGRNITLTGFIDRVDEYNDGDKRYLRVIDYKSGRTTFNMTKVYYGLQLQLLTYLNVLKTDGLGEAKAAYYYHVDKPIVDGVTDDEINYDTLLKRHDYYKSYLDKFKLDGFGEGSSDVLSKLELHEPSGKLDTINVTYNKDGALSKNSSVFSADDIDILLKYQEHKLKKIANDMFNGDISISPYVLDKKTPCDYCNYKDICGVKKSDGNAFRKLTKKGIDDIKEVLNDEEV
jgi:ATP-dependent helicase/nuclease subunit B